MHTLEGGKGGLREAEAHYYQMQALSTNGAYGLGACFFWAVLNLSICISMIRFIDTYAIEGDHSPS